MTMIRTYGVSTSAHAQNLADYLGNSKRDGTTRTTEKAGDYRGYNLTDWEDWAGEMERTRRQFGHDVPAQTGHKNEIMLHQCLAADPLDMPEYDGTMTEEKMWQWADDWVESEYPNQEVFARLHTETRQTEYGEVDAYCIHLAINRSDLETHNRSISRKPSQAKQHRRKLALFLDWKYELHLPKNAIVKEMDEDGVVRPYRVVDKNENEGTRVFDEGNRAAWIGPDEQKMRERGASNIWKDELGERIQAALDELPTEQAAFVDACARRGVTVTIRGKDISYLLEGHKQSIRGSRLGRGCQRELIESELGLNKEAERKQIKPSQDEDELEIWFEPREREPKTQPAEERKNDGDRIEQTETARGNDDGGTTRIRSEVEEGVQGIEADRESLRLSVTQKLVDFAYAHGAHEQIEKLLLPESVRAWEQNLFEKWQERQQQPEQAAEISDMPARAADVGNMDESKPVSAPEITAPEEVPAQSEQVPDYSEQEAQFDKLQAAVEAAENKVNSTGQKEATSVRQDANKELLAACEARNKFINKQCPTELLYKLNEKLGEGSVKKTIGREIERRNRQMNKGHGHSLGR